MNAEEIKSKPISTRFSRAEYLKFILPSLLGVLFFLLPIKIGD